MEVTPPLFKRCRKISPIHVINLYTKMKRNMPPPETQRLAIAYCLLTCTTFIKLIVGPKIVSR